MCSITERVNELSNKLIKLNEMKKLCKSLDKIKCILNENNNKILSQTVIECENNYYLDLNFDLKICKISDKTVSNNKSEQSVGSIQYFKCFWPKCRFNTKTKQHLDRHHLIHM